MWFFGILCAFSIIGALIRLVLKPFKSIGRSTSTIVASRKVISTKNDNDKTIAALKKTRKLLKEEIAQLEQQRNALAKQPSKNVRASLPPVQSHAVKTASAPLPQMPPRTSKASDATPTPGQTINDKTHFCHTCGSAMKQTAKFCPQCGAIQNGPLDPAKNSGCLV